MENIKEPKPKALSELKQVLLGVYDYLRNYKYKKSWGGPFNGQEFRQGMFLEIIHNFELDLIIETGTYRGTTTEFLSKHFSKLILTIESNKRFFVFSKLRFLFNSNIKLFIGDSRLFLLKNLKDTNFQSKYIFYYLDAHCNEDFPIIEELKIIFNQCEHSIVMIDDFQVPNDYGYKYDDYGHGKILSLKLLDQLENVKVFSFFPTQNSDKETGAKRGSVILTNSYDIKNKLLKLKSLRFFK